MVKDYHYTLPWCENRLNKNVGGASDNVLSTIKGDFYTLEELHRIKQGHQHGYGNIQ